MWVDVRSPSEFLKGHIPDAINIPLFSNEERALVGTTYKQKNRREAFALGLEFVAPKLEDLCKQLEEAMPRTIYCARGGMRSEWMAKLVGAPRLEGGYKVYRKRVHEMFAKEYRLIVIGGYTGSGKTEVLQQLGGLDLETLANHRGSSFGSLGEQPTQEQFENLLAQQLENEPLWVEDESRLLGKCVIPDPFFQQMKRAPVVMMDVPVEERIDRLVKEYGGKDLRSGIAQIEKRLGHERARDAILSLETDPHTSAALILHYYDRAYEFSLGKRRKAIYPVKGRGLSIHQWATKITNTSREEKLLTM